MSKVVSVIVPIYNAQDSLKDCLDSIINQTFRDLEIVLVNDGSKDDSLKIINEYAKKDKRIVVVDKKNGGVSSARNAGLKKSTGYYVCFVDADDTLEISAISHALSRMREDGSDFAMFGFNIVGDGGEKIYEPEDTCLVADGYAFDNHITSRHSVYIWNKILKREIIIKYFNEHFNNCEDFLFNSQFFNGYTKVSVIKDKLYNYTVKEKSLGCTYSDSYLLNLQVIVSKVSRNMNADISKLPYFCGFVFCRMLSCIASIEDKNKRKENIKICKQFFKRILAYAKCKRTNHKLAIFFAKLNIYGLAIKMLSK